MSFAAIGDLLADVVDEVLPGLSGPQRGVLEVGVLRAEAEGPAAAQGRFVFAFLGALRALSASLPVASTSGRAGPAANTAGVQTRQLPSFGGALTNEAFHRALVC
jgi:hypothetical protein